MWCCQKFWPHQICNWNCSDILCFCLTDDLLFLYSSYLFVSITSILPSIISSIFNSHSLPSDLQFSDGVGYGWIDSLRDHADKNVSDLMFQNAAFRFPENTPVSKEAYYYRSIFEEHYPQVSHIEEHRTAILEPLYILNCFLYHLSFTCSLLSLFNVRAIRTSLYFTNRSNHYRRTDLCRTHRTWRTINRLLYS